eukprot:UN00938
MFYFSLLVSCFMITSKSEEMRKWTITEMDLSDVNLGLDEYSRLSYDVARLHDKRVGELGWINTYIHFSLYFTIIIWILCAVFFIYDLASDGFSDGHKWQTLTFIQLYTIYFGLVPAYGLLLSDGYV